MLFTSIIIIAETNIFEVMELGAIPKMLKLLSSPDKIARCHAILCLCVMATQRKIMTMMLLHLHDSILHSQLLFDGYCIKVILFQLSSNCFSQMV